MKVELLAPAGSLESFYAAVNSGADSVYLGGKLFNARNYARNFDDEEMKHLVKYAHNKGVKVYVTMNTILKDIEITDTLNYAAFLPCFRNITSPTTRRSLSLRIFIVVFTVLILLLPGITFVILSLVTISDFYTPIISRIAGLAMGIFFTILGSNIIYKNIRKLP